MELDLLEILDTIAHHAALKDAPVRAFERVQTRDPFKVLIATILSSRTKDEVTSKAAERLFQHVQGPADLERLRVEQIERLIYPVGFYRNKAKCLARLPQALLQFGGEVPDSLDHLLTLPCVGRKTANLVLSRAFGKPAICVDTHVHRLANMWGIVSTKTPEQTEKALMKIIPMDVWSRVNPLLVAFGQKVCRPSSPRCAICPLDRQCQITRQSSGKST